MVSEVNTSFMDNPPRPLVVLLPFCPVGCDSPVPITVMFNQEVSRLSALSFVTQGRIMSLSSHYTNANPFVLVVAFEGYSIVRNNMDRIRCRNCEVVNVMGMDRNELRVVVRMQAEGTGSILIERGFFIDFDGEWNAEFPWEITYGGGGVDG